MKWIARMTIIVIEFFFHQSQIDWAKDKPFFQAHASPGSGRAGEGLDCRCCEIWGRSFVGTAHGNVFPLPHHIIEGWRDIIFGQPTRLYLQRAYLLNIGCKGSCMVLTQIVCFPTRIMIAFCGDLWNLAWFWVCPYSIVYSACISILLVINHHQSFVSNDYESSLVPKMNYQLDLW